jgi:hypothetical protein
VKCDWSAKPQLSAIWHNRSSVIIIISCARSVRRLEMYRANVSPKLTLKAREKWDALKRLIFAQSRVRSVDASEASMCLIT